MSTSRLLVGGAVLSLLIGGLAAFKRSDPSPAQSISPAPSPSIVPPVAASPSAASTPASVQSPIPTYNGYQAHQISTCAGQPSNANFRQFPSLATSAILGGVKRGDIVYLTGRTAYSSGVTWYEAIAPSLFPVPDPGAINSTQPNQAGWIASCFVSG